MTQLQEAQAGVVTDRMREVARAEGVEPEKLRRLVEQGLAVIPCNKSRRAAKVFGIGNRLRTKVNANIGTSPDCVDIELEREKLEAAATAGADSVMDLSTGGDVRAIRRRLLDDCDILFGTVPIYEAASAAARKHHNIRRMTADDMLRAVESSAADGVDFVTVHCGVTRATARTLAASKRLCGVVSRGGTFLIEWMRHNDRENPLYERFDEVLDICREHDVTISLGDGLRPGAIADAFDAAQVHELMVMAELARRARGGGVQVMIEGPGHVPLDQVMAQVKLEKRLCDGAPFYVLGPIVTDVAPGYDHITGAIGGALAAMAGADFLCYVTPCEHLGLPRPQHVTEGVIASRIAAHAADIAKGLPGASDWDNELSKFRRTRDWERQLASAMDPDEARRLHSLLRSDENDTCTMCGEYCVFKLADEDDPSPATSERTDARD